MLTISNEKITKQLVANVACELRNNTEAIGPLPSTMGNVLSRLIDKNKKSDEEVRGFMLPNRHPLFLDGRIKYVIYLVFIAKDDTLRGWRVEYHEVPDNDAGTLNININAVATKAEDIVEQYFRVHA